MPLVMKNIALEEDRTTVNIRKTKKNKGKKFIVKMNIFLEKGK